MKTVGVGYGPSEECKVRNTVDANVTAYAFRTEQTYATVQLQASGWVQSYSGTTGPVNVFMPALNVPDFSTLWSLRWTTDG